MQMVPLFSSSNIYWLALAQVGCTFLLASFAVLSTPDYTLLFLLLLCAIGNYAWIQHIEGGFGSANAMVMFQVSVTVAVGAIAIGFYRRWKHPELCIPDEEDEQDMEDVDMEELEKMGHGVGKTEQGRAMVQMGDVKKKDAAVKELKGRVNRKKLRQKDSHKAHLVNHIKTMGEINSKVKKN
jgi:hypothetical protein